MKTSGKKASTDKYASVKNTLNTTVKDAIIRSRFQAAKLVNNELLSLYYAVGKYVSNNSREGFWGQGAIANLSVLLQKELPGLSGFSEGVIRSNWSKLNG